MQKKKNFGKKNFYINFFSEWAHISPPFQQLVLHDWFKYISLHNKIHTTLDVGTGLGLNLKTLSKYSQRVLASDISRKALNKAKKNNSKLKNINYLCIDAEELRFARSIDVVVCTETLEHISNVNKVLNQVYKSLKPGGFFILSSPNYLNLSGVIKCAHDYITKRQDWEPWGVHRNGYERFTTSLGTEFLLKQWGFKVIKTSGANYLLAWLPLHKTINLGNKFPFLFLGRLPVIKHFAMHYYILAQKRAMNASMHDS